MRAQKKISYSSDVDILMIQLSNKKIDDAYETNRMIVHVDKNNEPVLLEIFNGKKYLKELGVLLEDSKLSASYSSVAHQIKPLSKK